MHDHNQSPNFNADPELNNWRNLHPEFTDDDWAEAVRELHVYLSLAWAVYRQQYPDFDLPDTL